jgi:hypothetical protein
MIPSKLIKKGIPKISKNGLFFHFNKKVAASGLPVPFPAWPRPFVRKLKYLGNKKRGTAYQAVPLLYFRPVTSAGSAQQGRFPSRLRAQGYAVLLK